MKPPFWCHRFLCGVRLGWASIAAMLSGFVHQRYSLQGCAKFPPACEAKLCIFLGDLPLVFVRPIPGLLPLFSLVATCRILKWIHVLGPLENVPKHAFKTLKHMYRIFSQVGVRRLPSNQFAISCQRNGDTRLHLCGVCWGSLPPKENPKTQRGPAKM